MNLTKNMEAPWLHLVLYEPEIPQNTGNIARICAGTNTMLHIVEPCGFILSETALKRAGLDYWDTVSKVIHRDWESCLNYFLSIQAPDKNLKSSNKLAEATKERIGRLPIHPVSTMGFTQMFNASHARGDILLFGSEQKGLPAEILDQWAENSIFIPQSRKIRSQNLANSVAVMVYHAAKKLDYQFI
jgi:tRNA (cytidine/uridine-2'-O-)-methyltransferase